MKFKYGNWTPLQTVLSLLELHFRTVTSFRLKTVSGNEMRQEQEMTIMLTNSQTLLSLVSWENQCSNVMSGEDKDVNFDWQTFPSCPYFLRYSKDDVETIHAFLITFIFFQNNNKPTAFFGKYLNEYNGSYVPVGWKEWSGLVRNSKYYNYTVNTNGVKVKYGSNYETDYFPDLITNQSLKFIAENKGSFPENPFLLVMSFPSPHGPEDSAPQFQRLFVNNTSHR